MAGTIAPSPKFTGLDNNGNIVAGGKLFTYAAGTTTKQATYSDSALTVANTNPVVMDSAGRATLFLSPTSYKFVFAPSTDTDPPANPYWTVDNVSAVPPANVDLDISGTAGEGLTAGQVVYLSAGSGGGTAGRWYKADATNTYSSTIAKSLGFVVSDVSASGTASIRQAGRVTGLSGLVAGTTYYVATTAGALTSVAPANAVPVGVADTTTSLVLSYWLSTISVTSSITSLTSSVTALQTLTSGAQGNKSTIDARLDVAIDGDGFLVNPLPKQVIHTAGTGSGTGPASVKVTTNVSATSNSGSGETNLHTYALPANSLDGTYANAVEFEAWGTMAANANSKTLRVYFGSTSIVALPSAAYNNTGWHVHATIIRTGASAQLMVCRAICGVASSGGNEVLARTATPAETLSGSVTVKVTGQGAASSDITCLASVVTVR